MTSGKTINHIFIVDPFESLKLDHDSSLALMKAALKAGDAVHCCELKDVMWCNSSLQMQSQKINLSADGMRLNATGESRNFNLSEASKTLVWMRKDPPVDENYIQVCQLLRLSSVPVINDPASLLHCDEKLFALEFPHLIPNSMIVSDISQIKLLLGQFKRLIAKPIGGKAGEGIVLLQNEDKNVNSLLEMLTNRGARKIILQEFLPAAERGDKRVFLCAGEPVGAVLRVPKKDDHRANMAAGGSIQATDITDEDLKICRELKNRLLELGLYVVGLDIIGNKLTEINITSPTCLEEIAQLNGSDPAAQIIQWSKQLIHQ